jgi:hypothetical protein
VQCFTLVAVEASYARMSKVYDRIGRDLYMSAGDREHD